MLQHEHLWRPFLRNDLGFLNTLSEVLAGVEKRHAGIFPNLRKAQCLFAASDYGGEHAGAAYQTIAFLLADIADCAAWQATREAVRAQYLPDRRRMAFKSLNDIVRRKALNPFLESANQLPGLLATFVVANTVKSLFIKGARLDANALDLDVLRTLSPAVAEKLMRIVHLLSLLIAGLSAPGQDLLWVTDEDAIAANAERVKHLVEALARVSSNCLPHGLRHLRVATARQDKGDLSVEDLLSIADLAAGSLSTSLETMLGRRGAPLSRFLLPRPTNVARKTRSVLDWFADNTQPLRRIVLMIDEEPATGHLRATHLRFHGSRDL
jgi:hypothetical protein